MPGVSVGMSVGCLALFDGQCLFCLVLVPCAGRFFLYFCFLHEYPIGLFFWHQENFVICALVDFTKSQLYEALHIKPKRATALRAKSAVALYFV